MEDRIETVFKYWKCDDVERGQEMKSYKNLYFIGAIIIFLLLFFLYRNISIDNLMLGLGYYDEKITVANTADVHGHIIYEDNSWGQYTSEDIYGVMGLPIAKGLYDKIKSENSIILDSGDMFHGTNEALINDGEGIVKVANGMGYAGAALGSNDFNFGYERLLEMKEELNYPILCANFYVDGKRVFEPYGMLTVGGKKVAVFGLITEHRSIARSKNKHISARTTHHQVIAGAADQPVRATDQRAGDVADKHVIA